MPRPGLALVLLIGLAGPGYAAQAQDAAADDPGETVKVASKARPAAKGAKKAAAGAPGVSVLGLVKSANPMLWPLGLCSVVTLGFVLERLLALRRGRVLPRDFVERFLDRLSSGKLDRERALELCRANESPAARVFAAVIKSWGQPSTAIRQAVGQEAGVEVADLKRNVRVLNGTATLAPLLGLLGTVIGMIESFDALGGRTAAGTAKSEALAHGISLALMTTAFGLAIAVVAVTAYYYLLNRVDVLVRDLDEEAGKVVDLVSAEAIRSGADRRVPGPSDLGRARNAEYGMRGAE